jgi:hypothetical protein
MIAHIECETHEFCKQEHLEQAFECAIKRFNQIVDFIRLDLLRANIHDFEGQFNHFDGEINSLRNIIQEAVDNNSKFKYSMLKRKAIELHKKIMKSPLYMDFLNFKASMSIMFPGYLSAQDVTETMKFNVALVNASEKIKELHDKKLNKTVSKVIKDQEKRAKEQLEELKDIEEINRVRVINEYEEKLNEERIKLKDFKETQKLMIEDFKTKEKVKIEELMNKIFELTKSKSGLESKLAQISSQTSS